MKLKLKLLKDEINMIPSQSKVLVGLICDLIDGIETKEDLSKQSIGISKSISKLALAAPSLKALLDKFDNILQEFTGETLQQNDICKNRFGIKSIKKYDIIFVQSQNEPIKHYHVVIGKNDGIIYTLCITSKQVFGKIPITKSRMFKGSYFCNSFFTFTESCVDDFYAIYDCKSEINSAIKSIKNTLNNL